LKIFKSLGLDNIPTKLTKPGGKAVTRELRKLLNDIWTKEELPKEWKPSVTVSNYKKGEKSD